MELNSIKRVFLIGIGGIGMSGLARYFQHRGCLVAGYDKTQTALTTQLEQENIEIAYHDGIDYIPFDFNGPEDGTLIIYTPAIPANSLILSFFQDKLQPKKTLGSSGHHQQRHVYHCCCRNAWQNNHFQHDRAYPACFRQ